MHLSVSQNVINCFTVTDFYLQPDKMHGKKCRCESFILQNDLLIHVRRCLEIGTNERNKNSLVFFSFFILALLFYDDIQTQLYCLIKTRRGEKRRRKRNEKKKRIYAAAQFTFTDLMSCDNGTFQFDWKFTKGEKLTTFTSQHGNSGGAGVISNLHGAVNAIRIKQKHKIAIDVTKIGKIALRFVITS